MKKIRANIPILTVLKDIGKTIFATREVAFSGAGTVSNTVQALNHLEKQGTVMKIGRGVWGLTIGGEKINPYAVIPYLLPKQRTYVSFISALHVHGIIEQIPQSITVATTGHTRTIKTKFGVYYFHQIAPKFFKGFEWYQSSGDFLIAEPEKALIDCLYLSIRRKKQFAYFPELDFPKTFSNVKAKKWIKEIPDARMQPLVLKKFNEIRNEQRKIIL